MNNFFSNELSKILESDCDNDIIFFQANLFNQGKNLRYSINDILNFFKKNIYNYTFIIPTHTSVYLFPGSRGNYFSINQKCTNGVLANKLVNSDLGIRSNHTTHSHYFIGKKSKEFSKLCNIETLPFEFLDLIGIEKISFININFKVIPTFHLIENKLGISKKFITNLMGSYYIKKNKKISWKKLKTFNGCDKNYKNLFEEHILHSNISKKEVKNYKIYFGNLKKIYDIDLNNISKNINILN